MRFLASLFSLTAALPAIMAAGDYIAVTGGASANADTPPVWNFNPLDDGIGEPFGPYFWGNLPAPLTRNTCDPSFGGQQAPINFQTVAGGEEWPAMDFEDINTKIQFYGKKCKGVNMATDAVWKMAFNECDFGVTVNGKNYDLLEFHIHLGEHTLNGFHYPLELHMVHANSDGSEALVLGVWITTGKFNNIVKILQSLPADANDVESVKAFNPYSLLPRNKAYWYYEGSLTAPSENSGYCSDCGAGEYGCQIKDGTSIQWYMFQNAVEASVAQISFFSSYFCQLGEEFHVNFNCMNNRPLQPILNGTIVSTSGKSANFIPKTFHQKA